MNTLSRFIARTEFRRGLAQWTFLVILAALLVAVFGDRSERYRQDWPSMAQYLRTLLLLFGPLIAAASCWQAGRERRRRITELLDSAPRPLLHRVTAAVLPVWLAAGAAYLLTWAVAAALTWPSASAYGHPLVGSLGVDLTVAALFTTGGFLIGWYVPWWSVAPVIAIGIYAVAGLYHVPASSGLAQLAPASFELRTYWKPAWWVSPAHAAWFAGLALAALLLVGARRTWLAVVPVAVAVCGAVPLMMMPTKMWLPDDKAVALVCEGQRPQICMRRAHEGQRDQYAPHIRWAYDLFHRVPTAPSRFEESKRGGFGSGPAFEPGADPDVSSFSLITHADLGSDRRLDHFRRDVVLQKMLLWNCEHESDQPEWTYGLLLWAWSQEPGGDDMEWVLRPDGSPPSPYEKAFTALKAMSEKQRTAWFTDYFAAARSCDAGKVAPPKAGRP